MCVFVHICACKCVLVHMCLYMCACTYVFACTYVCLYMCACTNLSFFLDLKDTFIYLIHIRKINNNFDLKKRFSGSEFFPCGRTDTWLSQQSPVVILRTHLTTSQLMLYREIIAVCSEIHTKHTNTLCEQNVQFLNIRPGGAEIIHWAWRVKI